MLPCEELVGVVLGCDKVLNINLITLRVHVNRQLELAYFGS